MNRFIKENIWNKYIEIWIYFCQPKVRIKTVTFLNIERSIITVRLVAIIGIFYNNAIVTVTFLLVINHLFSVL